MAHRIKDGDDAYHEIDKKPDTCPACGKGISPITCYSYGVDTWRRYEGFLQVVYRCPREECNRLFITSYFPSQYGGINDTLYLNKTFLLDSVEIEKFTESIAKISEKFPRIYNQAKIAEDNGLDTIAGPGYRKALEFLVKDYLIKTNPKLEEHVKKVQLGDAIKMVDDTRIKSCAERAAWLGNDETHYARQWEDKDMQDLKNLIKMVVDWIDLVERSKEYESSMPTKKSESAK
ncbi:DUF4145 domain-containing protein [Candidatus Gottesmanbacteria bacterium]|nr:DUF4145 domain-containing protein [Candidatus Gottesmanbacteria bacterium]